MKADLPFEVNEKPLHFQLGEDKILIEIENSMRHLAWRMTVNGKVGHISRYYQGLYIHEGYGLITNYFASEELPEFVPFKIILATEIK